MVEWKKLGEVCKVHTGSQLNKADMLENGPYPVVNGGKEYSGYTDKYNENAYTITISQGGESAGYVNWLEVCFWAGAHCYVVENPEGYNTRYLYHTLKNKERGIQLSKQGAGIPGLNRDTLYKQVIPIPSLEEQTRIVGILDTFTFAIDNLKEQIAQRRKQYEYYRDQLLDLEGKPGVEMKTLGEVCEISAGGDVPKDNMSQTKTDVFCIPIVSNGVGDKSIYGYTDLKKINKTSVTVAARGTIGYAEYRDYPYYPIVRLISVTPLVAQINARFLYYLLSKQKYKIPKSGIPQLTVPVISKVIFPLPPLSEQQRIVSILDTFEASISNLEAQLKEREKQYEYYRNKLLTFE